MYSPLQLSDPNNFGCKLRDAIVANWDAFKVNGTTRLSLLRQKFSKIVIPKEYWSDILIMVNHNKYKRTTHCVEQLLEGVVMRGIIKNLIDKEVLS